VTVEARPLYVVKFLDSAAATVTVEAVELTVTIPTPIVFDLAPALVAIVAAPLGVFVRARHDLPLGAVPAPGGRSESTMGQRGAAITAKRRGARIVVSREVTTTKGTP
jgi:hypothetical protein